MCARQLTQTACCFEVSIAPATTLGTAFLPESIDLANDPSATRRSGHQSNEPHAYPQRDEGGNSRRWIVGHLVNPPPRSQGEQGRPDEGRRAERMHTKAIGQTTMGRSVPRSGQPAARTRLTGGAAEHAQDRTLFDQTRWREESRCHRATRQPLKLNELRDGRPGRFQPAYRP